MVESGEVIREAFIFISRLNEMKPSSSPSSREAKRRSRPSSPTRLKEQSTISSGIGVEPTASRSRSSSSRLSPSTTLLDDTDLVTELQDYANSEPNPRSFPYAVKQQCWEKAEKIKGRDPDRWRRDALGNIVFRKLVGCPGCLCHDYDHIIPYSKGGKSTLENCQVLQATVNRSKGNRTELSKAELIEKSSYCRVSGRDMDLLELSAYGNVRRGPDSGGCRIQ